jgi:predicted nucleic acid-binding protein
MVDRIFLDANVLFSIAYGSPGLKRLEERSQKKRCLLFASNYVIEEAKRNLSNPSQLKRLEIFLSNVQIIPEMDPQLPCPIHMPEKDRPVLLAAISIRADYLLTGDITHFRKYFGRSVSGVTICLPRDYLITRPSVDG